MQLHAWLRLWYVYKPNPTQERILSWDDPVEQKSTSPSPTWTLLVKKSNRVDIRIVNVLQSVWLDTAKSRAETRKKKTSKILALLDMFKNHI